MNHSFYASFPCVVAWLVAADVILKTKQRSEKNTFSSIF